MYSYDKSCINARLSTPIQLMNDGGKFKVYETSKNYSHSLTYPMGSWYDNANWVTFFPNSVCVFYLKEVTSTFLEFYQYSHTVHNYVEICTEYEDKEYVHRHNMNFVIKRTPSSLSYGRIF